MGEQNVSNVAATATVTTTNDAVIAYTLFCIHIHNIFRQPRFKCTDIQTERAFTHTHTHTHTHAHTHTQSGARGNAGRGWLNAELSQCGIEPRFFCLQI